MAVVLGVSDLLVREPEFIEDVVVCVGEVGMLAIPVVPDITSITIVAAIAAVATIADIALLHIEEAQAGRGRVELEPTEPAVIILLEQALLVVEALLDGLNGGFLLAADLGDFGCVGLLEILDDLLHLRVLQLQLIAIQLLILTLFVLAELEHDVQILVFLLEVKHMLLVLHLVLLPIKGVLLDGQTERPAFIK